MLHRELFVSEAIPRATGEEPEDESSVAARVVEALASGKKSGSDGIIGEEEARGFSDRFEEREAGEDDALLLGLSSSSSASAPSSKKQQQPEQLDEAFLVALGIAAAAATSPPPGEEGEEGGGGARGDLGDGEGEVGRLLRGGRGRERMKGKLIFFDGLRLSFFFSFPSFLCLCLSLSL